MTKTHLILSAAALAVLSLQACGEPAAKATEPATVPATTASPAPAQGGSTISIDGAALKIGGKAFALDTPKAEVLAAATAAIGSPPVVAEAFEGCGAGPMDHAAWDNGLDLLFQDDRLGGWQTQTPDISDAKGIHVGSTLAELKAAYPATTLAQDTLGWAFMAGDLTGYLDETKAFIQRINIGVTCDAT